MERHTSICRAVQLGAKYETVTLLKSLADEDPAAVTTIDADECFSQQLSEIAAERTLLPILLADLEKRIDTAWARLDQVSPSQRRWA
jgi:hypothetical protein